jgi:hypothetical protein
MARLCCPSPHTNDYKTDTPWTVRFKTITPDDFLETQLKLKDTRTNDVFPQDPQPSAKILNTPYNAKKER